MKEERIDSAESSSVQSDDITEIDSAVASEKDSDHRDADTYRIYDYLKKNPALTVAILSGTAALVTLLLNLVVYIINVRIQRTYGLYFLYQSNMQGGYGYYNALLSFAMTVAISFYTFLSADAGDTINYNTVMLRYAKEYSNYAEQIVKKSESVIRNQNPEPQKYILNDGMYTTKSVSFAYSDAGTKAEKDFTKSNANLNVHIMDLRSKIKELGRKNFLKVVSELLAPFLLYSGVTFLYMTSVSNRFVYAIITTGILVIVNGLIPIISYLLSAWQEKVPKCTDENVKSFYMKMDQYLDREPRAFITKRMREKGFRTFFSDREVFSSFRSFLMQLAITCIFMAVLLNLIPTLTKEYPIIEYDEKAYIVVTRNENDYALIEADIIDDDTLEIHRKIERHLTSGDLVIEKKTFKKVVFE